MQNMLLIPLPVWALKHVDLGSVGFRLGATMVNNFKANSKRLSLPSQTIGEREENREKEKMRCLSCIEELSPNR